MSVRKGSYVIAGTPRTTGGVEIGDMGFAPLGIDESLNLRRYMNGQVISQTQFVSFTNKIKSAIALYPNLATTESNWQAEKALSKFGQCGKFVVDDTAQTIRLPAVVNAQGLLSLSGIGNLVNESLPNIKESVPSSVKGDYGNNSGTGSVFEKGPTSEGYQYTADGGYGLTTGFNFDVSRKYPVYQDGAPVQQEAVQYPYYIQVATGVEETLPAIREYQVNNSDYFGKSMYSDIAPNNASWLASNGSYNARSVYPDYYDWLVERVNNGVNDFITTNFREYAAETTYVVWTNDAPPVVGMRVYGYAWSQGGGYVGRFTVSAVSGNSITFMDTVSNIEKTCTYSKTVPSNVWDSAFVVNQNDQTFRLPLLNGEEDLLGDRKISLTIGATGSSEIAPANGFYCLHASNNTNSLEIYVGTSTNFTLHATSYDTAGWNGVFVKVSKGDRIEYYYAGTGTPDVFQFIYAKGNGTLYYYVGDTVQDASLINAGAVLGQLSNKADIDASNFNADGKSLLSGLGMPSNRYIDLTLGASGSTYTAPANGYFSILGAFDTTPSQTNGVFISMSCGGMTTRNSGTTNISYGVYISAKKGQSMFLEYKNFKMTGYSYAYFRFIYAEGEN